ncbi:OST-HTH/LOTUS domain-containing protein [Aeromonas caviae]|uniref:OST-HTH/LOTUS domain-containing protein n=1 Tax=Aeromonas caviae TaxID=648 RepID=UPI00338F689A
MHFEVEFATKLINLLRQAIDAIGEDDGWAMLGEIGNHISNHASFDPTFRT